MLITLASPQLPVVVAAHEREKWPNIVGACYVKPLVAWKRPTVERYDIAADPCEVKYLAACQNHKHTLGAMRKRLAK